MAYKQILGVALCAIDCLEGQNEFFPIMKSTKAKFNHY